MLEEDYNVYVPGKQISSGTVNVMWVESLNCSLCSTRCCWQRREADNQVFWETHVDDAHGTESRLPLNLQVQSEIYSILKKGLMKGVVTCVCVSCSQRGSFSAQDRNDIADTVQGLARRQRDPDEEQWCRLRGLGSVPEPYVQHRNVQTSGKGDV